MAKFAGVRIANGKHSIKIRPSSQAATSGDVKTGGKKVLSWSSDKGRSRWLEIGTVWEGVITEVGHDDERFEIHHVG